MKRHRLKTGLIILGVVVMCGGILLVSGGYAFAATSVNGFNDSLIALLDGLKQYFEAVLDLFGMILP